MRRGRAVRYRVTDTPPEELNLTPYLDVLMNLIVFVLVSGAGLLTFGAVPANTSSPGAHGAAASVPRVHLERDRMTLTTSPERSLPP